MLKLKFPQKLAILNVMNSGLETVIFNLKDMLGILDVRSMDYYKIKKEYYSKTLVNITSLNQLIFHVGNLIDL